MIWYCVGWSQTCLASNVHGYLLACGGLLVQWYILIACCIVLQWHRVINVILRGACFVPGIIMWYRVGCGQTYLASNVHEYLLARGTLLAQ